MARTRRIEIIVIADDQDDLDLADATGLTLAAFERLSDSIVSAGFAVESLALRPVFPGES